MDYSTYTDEQKKVIFHEEGAVVLATPGSGKTHTIVGKIKHICETNPTAKTLYITFTRKAREEGESRIGNSERVRVTNYHGLAYQILDFHKGDLHRKEIDIVGDSYCLSVLKSLMPGKKKKEIKEALKEINNIKQKEIPLDSLEDSYRILFNQFNNILKNEKKYSYSDLIPEVNKLFTEDKLKPAMRGMLRFDYIMNDETQDANTSQMHMLENIKNINDSKMYLVGDVIQSIYGFGGASPYVTLDAISKYDLEVLPLSKTFRCQNTVIDLANTVSSSMSEFQEMVTEMVPTRRERNNITVNYCSHFEEMNQMVINQVRSLMRSNPEYKYSDFKVLFRTNRAGLSLQKAFAVAGIPLKLITGNLLDKKSIQHYIATVRFLESVSEDGEDSPDVYNGIIGFAEEISEDIGFKTIELINNTATGMSFMDTLRAIDSLKIKGVGPKKKVSLLSFHNEISSLIKDYEQATSVEDKHRIITDFIMNFKFVNKSVAYYDSVEEDLKDLGDILSDMGGSLLERVNKVLIDFSEETEGSDDKVIGMTSHKSKGAEAKVVIVYQYDQYGMFSEDECDEERRLLYVTFTRAKNHLHVYQVGYSQNREYEEYFEDLEKQGRVVINNIAKRAGMPPKEMSNGFQ